MFKWITKYITDPMRSASSFLGSHKASTIGNSIIDGLSKLNLINSSQVKTGRDVMDKIKVGADTVTNVLDKID